MLYLYNCIVRLRELDTKEIGAKLFRQLQNVVLEKNGENKMFRDIY